MTQQASLRLARRDPIRTAAPAPSQPDARTRRRSPGLEALIAFVTVASLLMLRYALLP